MRMGRGIFKPACSTNAVDSCIEASNLGICTLSYTKACFVPLANGATLQAWSGLCSIIFPGLYLQLLVELPVQIGMRKNSYQELLYQPDLYIRHPQKQACLSLGDKCFGNLGFWRCPGDLVATAPCFMDV